MHVAAEVLVLIGIIYYINQKNNTCVSSINKLVQRIEEQEDIIQRHEQIITKLVASLKAAQAGNSKRVDTSPKRRQQKTPLQQTRNKIASPPPPPPPNHTDAEFDDDHTVDVEESDHEEDEELNIEELLADELKELEDNGVESGNGVEILNDGDDENID